MSGETTELKTLSKLKKAGKLRYWRGTIEIPETELHAICDEIQAEHDQAIVATLESDGEYEAKMDALLCRLTNGKWSKSRAYSLDFMVSCVDEEYEDAYEKERAELGNGTLTAEQMREVIERNFGKVAVLDDGKPVEWRDDWVCRVGINYQAIADELNAELGSGTCELIDRGKFTPHHDFHRVECSECGVLFWQSHGHLPPARFCPSCGKRVKKAVES